MRVFPATKNTIDQPISFVISRVSRELEIARDAERISGSIDSSIKSRRVRPAFFMARILCSNPRRLIRLDQFTRDSVKLGDSDSSSESH